MSSDSAQKHWLQSNGVLGHTHIDLDCIGRPSVSDVLVVKFAIHMFKVTGQIGPIYAGNYKTNDAFDFVWDATNSSTPPPMPGDPSGEIIYTGRFSVKPGIPHGWMWVSMSVYTNFVNASNAVERTTVIMLNEPIFSIVDPSVPAVNEFDPAAQRVQASGRVSPDTAHPEFFYGEETIQVDGAFPYGPWNTEQDITTSGYGYGSRGMPEAVIDVVLDADLHHGIQGTALYRMSEPIGNGLIHASTPLFPAVIGSGDHKLMFRRTMQVANEFSAVLLVARVNVADAPVPVKVTVPDLVGRMESEAKAVLEDIGLASSSTTAVDTRPIGTVIAQSPSVGSQVNKGSVVTLVLSAGQDAWVSTTDTVVVEKLGAQEKYRLNVKGHTVDLS